LNRNRNNPNMYDTEQCSGEEHQDFDHGFKIKAAL